MNSVNHPRHKIFTKWAHTGPHISPENRNYSATDPENSETFPQANSQIYVVLEWFILLLQKHTNTNNYAHKIQLNLDIFIRKPEMSRKM